MNTTLNDPSKRQKLDSSLLKQTKEDPAVDFDNLGASDDDDDEDDSVFKKAADNSR